MALVPLQADIERALTNFIREELNSNSFGVHFSLGYWTNTTDRDGQNVEIMEVEGSKYETEEVRIIPMSIEAYDGNITNIEGLFNADYNVPLTFQINVDDEDHFEKAINAINEVKNTLRGQIKRLEVSHNGITEKFTAVTATDNLTPQGNLTIMMGQTYVFAGLSISFDISKNINYGNQVWIYLAEYDEDAGETLPDNDASDYTRIFALAPSFNRSNNPEAFQNFDTSDVVHIIKDSEYTFAMQMFIQDDDLHWSLLEDVIKKEALNKPYSLKLDFKYYYKNNAQTTLSFDTFNDFPATGDSTKIYVSLNDGKEYGWVKSQYIEIINGLVTKFSFLDAVVILDATPSFSIGEPQYLEVAFGKYLTESEVTDPGDIPELPGLPRLESPEYVNNSIQTSFTNLTSGDDVLGVYASVKFVNKDTTTSDIRVCIGNQCVTEENVEEDEEKTFYFSGLTHDTELTFSAVAVGDGENFNNSTPTLEPFTTVEIVDISNMDDGIGAGETVNGNPDGFDFTITNPYDFPVNVFVRFEGNLNQPSTVNANSTKNISYTNNDLVQDTNNTINFVYETLDEYGNTRRHTSSNRTIFIPAIPQAAEPEIKNVSVSRNDTQVVVSWDVQNKYNENVDIITSIGSDNFSELDVPELGESGDTVNFTKTYTQSSDLNQTKTITAKAESTIQGELDSEEDTETVNVPNLITSELEVNWVPTTQTDRVVFDVKNNYSYLTGFDAVLYLNDVEVPNSAISTDSGEYDELDFGETKTLQFINGQDNLIIDGNGINDVYKLSVNSKSSGRDDTGFKFYEGYLARKVSDYVFSFTQDSNLTTSFIRATFTNNEPEPVVVSYGMGIQSSYQANNIIDSVTLSPGQTSDEIEFAVSGNNVNNDQYIYYKLEPNSDYLLPTDNLVSEAITPEPLQTGYEVEFVDFDDTLIEEEGFENPQLVEEGEDAVAPSNPARDYYTFDSWDNAFINVQQNLTVKAQYNAIEYDINYNINTINFENTNPNKYTIEDLPLALNNPTKEGYEFNGWYKEQSFTTQLADINTTDFPNLGNITIYGDLQEITLDPVEFTTESTVDAITITATNPTTNPNSNNETSIVTRFGLRKKSDNTVVSTLTTRTFSSDDSVPEYTTWVVEITGLDDSTQYEIFGDGTNDAIRTFDTNSIYVENEQNTIDVSTVTPVGDKTLRVKLNIFGPTTTENVSWQINGNAQSSITVNNDTFTTFANDLFDGDNVTISAPQTAGGQSFQSFVVNGVTETVDGFSITESVGEGLDIEINYA